MAITFEQIQASYFVYLNENLTITTSIEWQGILLEKEGIDGWLEVWVDVVERKVQRKVRSVQKDVRRVELRVDCHSKRTTETYRIWDMVKDVCDVLEHAEIPLRDYNSVGDPIVGYLRVNEPRRNDITRERGEQIRHDTYGVALTFPANAQES